MASQLAVGQKTDRIQVLIVDDHPIIRMGLAQLLSTDPTLHVSGEASDMGGAIQQIQSHKPDVALIDISLESSNGIELIKQIRAIDNSIRMIAISMHDDLLYAERALRAGAMGYINKQEVAENIIKAIHQVKNGNIHVSDRVTTRLLHQAVNGGAAIKESPVECLSDRELEVFEMIGRGMMTSEIATKLHLSLKTIETHRENIKAKLKLRNANELIRYAVQCAIENG